MSNKRFEHLDLEHHDWMTISSALYRHVSDETIIKALLETVHEYEELCLNRDSKTTDEVTKLRQQLNGSQRMYNVLKDYVTNVLGVKLPSPTAMMKQLKVETGEEPETEPTPEDEEPVQTVETEPCRNLLTYKKNKAGLHVTDCPFGPNEDGTLNTVGSRGCQKCKYFGFKNNENVGCNHE